MDDHTFTIPPALQVVIAVQLTQTAEDLRGQMNTRTPIRVYGSEHDLPYVSDEVCEQRAKMCMELVAAIWDRAAADMLADGQL